MLFDRRDFREAILLLAYPACIYRDPSNNFLRAVLIFSALIKTCKERRRQISFDALVRDHLSRRVGPIVVLADERQL